LLDPVPLLGRMLSYGIRSAMLDCPRTSGEKTATVNHAHCKMKRCHSKSRPLRKENGRGKSRPLRKRRRMAKNKMVMVHHAHHEMKNGYETSHPLQKEVKKYGHRNTPIRKIEMVHHAHCEKENVLNGRNGMLKLFCMKGQAYTPWKDRLSHCVVVNFETSHYV
jgi:hypothetical protein